MAKVSIPYFVVPKARRLSLKDFPTQVRAPYRSDEEYAKRLQKLHAAIEEFQTLLYSGQKRGMIILFQGMDTAGKDGAIKHVMSGVNPQGCSVTSFKTPGPGDLAHDFMWRTNRALPERGMIGIFNRSYYEEVLITRVHQKVLADEHLPVVNGDGKFWERRYRDISGYEKYLHHQGYEIVKVFIHISKGEQKKRLLSRFEDPKKQWKISKGDIRERAFWKEYQKAYSKCIGETSSQHAPWYIVPGDDKELARLSIAQILVGRFKQMKLKSPLLGAEERRTLARLKAQLAGE